MTERDLFLSALDLPTPEARAAFLADRCGPDADLRRRVEGLLAAHAEAGSFLEPPGSAGVPPALRLGASPGTAGVPPAPLPTADLPPQPAETADRTSDPPTADPPRPPLPVTTDHDPAADVGTRIGPYRLLQKLGEGGMGTVWVAEQTEPVKRRVALKVIKPGMDSARVVARFEAERQALALMDHTSIAKVFDGGTTPAGRPYFVMELVKGVPITAYCDELHLSIRDRLGLFVQVCAAVQHAHQKGVIHRDIKPSNVLVAVQDGRPVPKVIDFGVAKAVGARLADQTLYTEIGAVIGTLEYMAPEQAELSALDVDTRADVYALGVLLFELLTGTTPLTRQRLKAAGFAAMLRAIKEEEAPKPSTRLTESKESLAGLAAVRRTDPKRLAREVRGELDWIVLRALEKDRTRRYDTANGFSRDVQRYLADEVVEARPPSPGYRLRKLVRRNKGPVVAAGLVAAALLLGIAGTTWGLVRADTARQAEADQRRAAEAATEAERVAKSAEAEQRVAAEMAAAAERAAREAAQKSLAQADRGANLLFGVFADLDPDGALRDGGAMRAALADRLAKAADELDGDAFADPLAVARLQNRLGGSLLGLLPARAVPVLEKARAALAGRGPNDPEYLAVLNNLGLGYLKSGRPGAAVPLHEEHLLRLRAARGPNDPGTLQAMSNLSATYAAVGRSDQAISLHRECLGRRRAVLGAGHQDTLVSLNNLAATYLQFGRPPEAVPLLEECAGPLGMY